MKETRLAVIWVQPVVVAVGSLDRRLGSVVVCVVVVVREISVGVDSPAGVVVVVPVESLVKRRQDDGRCRELDSQDQAEELRAERGHQSTQVEIRSLGRGQIT